MSNLPQLPHCFGRSYDPLDSQCTHSCRYSAACRDRWRGAKNVYIEEEVEEDDDDVPVYRRKAPTTAVVPSHSYNVDVEQPTFRQTAVQKFGTNLAISIIEALLREGLNFLSQLRTWANRRAK